MSWNEIAGNWKQASTALQNKWGELTDSDLSAINGNREALILKLQERYGVAAAEAEKMVAEFAAEFRPDDDDAVAIEGDPVDMETLRIGM